MPRGLSAAAYCVCKRRDFQRGISSSGCGPTEEHLLDEIPRAATTVPPDVRGREAVESDEVSAVNAAYYNEHDDFAASWLEELIKGGHIMDGVVDRRSIDGDWRPTHHPHYEVSRFGQVRSWAPRGGNVRGGKPFHPTKPRLLRPGIASNGYPTVSFGRQHGSQCVHVLVAAAFLGPCPKGQECRHKDDNRANAWVENLEYGTRQDNVNDMMARGRQRRHSILAAADIPVIRQLIAAGISQTVIARQYGVVRQTITSIVIGRNWKRA